MSSSSSSPSPSPSSSPSPPSPPPLPSHLRLSLGTYSGELYGLESILNTEDLLYYDMDDTNPSPPTTLRPLFSLSPHRGSLKTLSSSPSGHWLITGGADETLRLFDLKRRREFGALHRHFGTIHSVSFFGEEFAVSCGAEGAICVWRVKGWECIGRMKGHRGDVYGISIHPSGKLGLSIGKDRSVRIWDFLRGKLTASLTLPKEPSACQFEPSKGNFYFLIIWDSLTVYNALESSQVTLQWKTEKNVKIQSAHWVSEEIIAVGGENGDLTLLGTSGENDSKEGKILYSHKIFNNRVKGMDILRVTPSVCFLSAICTDGTVKILRISTETKGAKQKGKGKEKDSVSVSVSLVCQAKSDSRLTSVCFLRGWGTAADEEKRREDDNEMREKRKNKRGEEDEDEEQEEQEKGEGEEEGDDGEVNDEEDDNESSVSPSPPPPPASKGKSAMNKKQKVEETPKGQKKKGGNEGNGGDGKKKGGK